jgi:hypothetical protein
MPASHVSKSGKGAPVADVQAWIDSIERLAPSPRARKISSVKSLFGFGHRLGYLPFRVGCDERALLQLRAPAFAVHS